MNTNPRFVWLIGSIKEEFQDVPEPSADGALVLWDRLHGQPVATVSPEYAQAICLETTENDLCQPFTTMEKWFNELSKDALESEGLPV